MSKKKRPGYIKAYKAWTTLVSTEIFSGPITRGLGTLKVHPNMITVLSALAGLACGLFFARGQWVYAALLFELSCFCDDIDGNIARLRGMTTNLGAKLDFIADSTRKPSAFIGIAFFFYFNHQLSLVMLSMVAFVVHFAIHKLFSLAGVSEYDLEFPAFHRKVVRRVAPRLLNLHSFFDEQIIEFVIFPLAAGIVGMPEGAIWFFYGAALLACLGLLKLGNSLMYRKRGKYDEIYQDWAGTKGNLDNP